MLVRVSIFLKNYSLWSTFILEKTGILLKFVKCFCLHCLEWFRQQFADICNGKVDSKGMVVMQDVAIAKSEFKEGERAVTKIQEFQTDPVLFQYCSLPEVKACAPHTPPTQS